DSRTTSLLHPARQIQLPSLQRGEGEAMLTALTHLSRSPLEQNIIQPLVLSLLHLCRNVVNMPPGNSQPRGEYGNLLEAKQQRLVEGEMLFIPARAANLPVNNKPVMLLSLVFAPTWLGLSF
ncbi:TPA: hypothetical protein ACWCIL_005489, partial [Escherichia coli]